MITIVKYEALKNASKTLQSTIDSDILYKYQQTLTEIYEWLEIEDTNHQCFDSSMNLLTDIQADSVKPIEDYMKLATIIPIIIETFSSAEDSEIRKLKNFINNFFQTETIGLLPFIYKEIQKVNDESNGKVVSNDFASCCQGVATYTDTNGKNYIYATQSYGANHDSVIQKYEITDTGLKEVGATTIDTPGLEGIQIDNQGNLSGVFENFKDTDNPNKTINVNVNTLDFSKSLDEINPELEKFYVDMGTENQKKLNS